MHHTFHTAPSRRALALAAALLLLCGPAAGPAVAQRITKTGTTIGQFLLIEPSARAAAMGGTGVASAFEIQSAYQNPGALGQLGRTGAQFTHMEYLADVRYDHAATAVAFGANTLLVSLTYLNSGEMDVRTVEQPGGTGERFEVSNVALGVGAARRLTDRFSAGARVQYVRETIWHSTLDAFSVDAGVLYRLPVGATLGASLSNFGSRGRYDGRDLAVNIDPDPGREGDNPRLPGSLATEDFSLPILFRVGMAYPVAMGEAGALSLAFDAYQPSDNTPSMSVGAEYRFRDVVAFRGGYEKLFEQDSEKGLTLGGGLGMRLGTARLTFDYAWARHDRLGNPQRFTLGFTL